MREWVKTKFYIGSVGGEISIDSIDNKTRQPALAKVQKLTGLFFSGDIVKYLKVVDWDKWQSYRKDRGTPPWIKIHRNLMTNPEWIQLSDAEKGQLVSIWITAADKKGRFSSDAKVLQKMCGLDDPPNISKLKALGFIATIGRQDDVTMTPECLPDDAPETETETETDIETDKKTLSVEPDIFSSVITYLNQKAEKKFKVTANHRKFMNARINEGFNFSDFQLTIDNMVKVWKDDPKMERYLRPSTLFSNKMDGYINLNPEAKEKTETEKFIETGKSWIKKSKEPKNGERDIFSGVSGFKARGLENPGGVYPRSMVQRPAIDIPRRLPGGDSGSSENGKEDGPDQPSG